MFKRTKHPNTTVKATGPTYRTVDERRATWYAQFKTYQGIDWGQEYAREAASRIRFD